MDRLDMKVANVGDLKGGSIWWSNTVEQYGGAMWWSNMVEQYGGAIWWSNMVEQYGGAIRIFEPSNKSYFNTLHEIPKLPTEDCTENTAICM
jgi:hypothetical protein